jgi:uncharacterized protein
MVDYAKARYNLLGGEASHWFRGSRADEFDENALKPLLAASPFADRIPEIIRETHAMLGGAQAKRLSQS